MPGLAALVPNLGSMPLGLLDFLNSREDAILFWTVVIFGYAFSRNPRGIDSGLLGAVRTLYWKLLIFYGFLAAYCALLVAGAERLGLWHMSSLKPTIYWFVGSAVVLGGMALTSPNYLRSALKRVTGITILVEFIVNLYVFPFAYELVLVLIATLFIGVQVLQHDASTDPRARRFIDGTLVTIVLIYLIYFVISALGDLDRFLSRENAEAFLVGPALTLALIPFLYLARRLSQWEQERIRRRFRSAPRAAPSE